MPVHFIFALRLFPLILLLLGAFQAKSQGIDVWAEEFEPFSYKGQNGEIVGMSAELVQSLVEDAGIEVANWQFIGQRIR